MTLRKMGSRSKLVSLPLFFLFSWMMDVFCTNWERLRFRVVYCFRGFCDKTQSYIGKTRRHLVVRVQEHLSGKSAIREHISSCKDRHSCSIGNFCIKSQVNTDFEAEIKEGLYIMKYMPKLHNQIYLCGSSFV